MGLRSCSDLWWYFVRCCLKSSRQVGHTYQGRIQDFKLGGAHLEKFPRAEGDAKIFGVFRVKNHDFMPKNHIISNCGGRRENFWGISCEKSRFYTKKSYFFSILGGGGAHPPRSAPAYNVLFMNDHYIGRKSSLTSKNLTLCKRDIFKFINIKPER